jgi:hypothetical protein
MVARPYQLGPCSAWMRSNTLRWIRMAAEPVPAHRVRALIGYTVRPANPECSSSARTQSKIVDAGVVW